VIIQSALPLAVKLVKARSKAVADDAINFSCGSTSARLFSVSSLISRRPSRFGVEVFLWN
jgi:hypothetical protein